MKKIIVWPRGETDASAIKAIIIDPEIEKIKEKEDGGNQEKN